ncbi:PREDICTED: UDP-glucuronosyltransferase 2B9-like [Colobus angolensis palliatus]|uniref:UDP-glucuronosyltransferase 2B9-like n=1 Tax=Colobus angolensis palliatus TaxID=336983 RepID=UPI0005F584FD|nr:PREDICTED: UDP-glucuronosyltransferase 2B9-like [Colobus angolensis palliatus]
MKEFVQISAKDGTVVFSLGPVVQDLTEGKADLIVSDLAQIPQKVLVWAAEYSHWMNMKTILEELVHRGHEVTVLASSASILFDPNNSSALKFEVFPTSLTKTEFNNISMQEIKRWSELPKDTFWLYFSQMQEMMWMFGDIIRNFCKDMVSNKKLMKKLEEARFDILFFFLFLSGRPTTLTETMGKADIWLIRNSWNFQFPHPLLPNVDFVGGLHCKPAKPLPKEMEEFVQSSGENGVVVFSLGSMVINMKEERANVIASALAQIPQKVLWRFDGKKPDTLGLNTRLYKWIPQNDLLGLFQMTPKIIVLLSPVTLYFLKD